MMLDQRLLGRVVVISPHLDDAVLSVGATMAHAVEAGAQVEVLTVFASPPGSTTPADDWERRSGFATEGEAARLRRIEDRDACSRLGVTPRWLDFGHEPYDRGGSLPDIIAAVTAVTAGADTVLIPGHPLAHADHAVLSNALLDQKLNCRSLGLYLEQPYAFDRRLTLRGPAEGRDFTWQPSPAHSRHRHMKLHAVKQYRSQIGLLGLRQRGVGHLRLRLMLWQEARQGGETIAWPNAT